MANKKNAPSTNREPVLSFEDTVQRLGHIVEELEAGELPLEESLKLFEEGVGLAKKSQDILDRAERRVEQLLGIDESGNPLLKQLEDQE